ncbi:hypothetical protein BS78_04G161800 [Paspalum vaginatum]|nr:hypothetical protein BS78_04G161800 [Paspalum vaginatum]
MGTAHLSLVAYLFISDLLFSLISSTMTRRPLKSRPPRPQCCPDGRRWPLVAVRTDGSMVSGELSVQFAATMPDPSSRGPDISSRAHEVGMLSSPSAAGEVSSRTPSDPAPPSISMATVSDS